MLCVSWDLGALWGSERWRQITAGTEVGGKRLKKEGYIRCSEREARVRLWARAEERDQERDGGSRNRYWWDEAACISRAGSRGVEGLGLFILEARGKVKT